MNIIYTKFPMNMSKEEHKLYFEVLIDKYKFKTGKDNSLIEWERYNEIKQKFFHNNPHFIEKPNQIVILEANLKIKTFDMYLKDSAFSNPIMDFNEFVDYIIKNVSIEISRIGTKWEDPYLQMLGVIDHCREVVSLYDAWKISKPFNNVGTTTNKEIENQIPKEMMDLLLILEEWSKGKEKLRELRINNFREKQGLK